MGEFGLAPDFAHSSDLVNSDYQLFRFVTNFLHDSHFQIEYPKWHTRHFEETPTRNVHLVSNNFGITLLRRL